MNWFCAGICSLTIRDFLYFNPEQKKEVYSGLVHYNLPLDKVKVYALVDFNSEYMRIMKRALARGVSKKDVKDCCTLDISPWRFNAIMEGIINNLPVVDIALYANPDISDIEAFEIYTRIAKIH